MKAFALVDSNNFYASCERVWNPKVRNLPVLVLSNNDGCAIARSQEVKDLGIKMGQPFYQIKDLCKKNNVQVFSANFTLYADFSHRVVQTLRAFSPDIEVYSVDESFLALDGISSDLTEYGIKIKKTIQKNIGLPVGIGIGPTKTLAKVANHLAKKHPVFKELGVCNIFDLSDEKLNEYLKNFFVGDIWGVGRSFTRQLTELGIDTAYKLKTCDITWIRKKMKVLGARTVLELRGTSCLNLELVRDHAKSIASTRSFGKPVFELQELEEAVTLYASRAAEKLRKNNCTASIVHVFLKTNKHKKFLPQYYNSISLRIPDGSFDTVDIVKTALQALRKIYKKGFSYKKAGVMLFGIESLENKTFDLFDLEKEPKLRRKENRMKALDAVNRKWGSHTLFLASRGVKQLWAMRSFNRSPRYNTNWRELPEVR